MNFQQWLDTVCANLACGMETISHLAEELHSAFRDGDCPNDTADRLISKSM
jgi:hypothetical protein